METRIRLVCARLWHPQRMRRLALVAGAALLVTGLADAATATGPSLRLTSTKPFVVKGSRFRAPERVLVTVTIKRQQYSRRVRTTTGQFAVRFDSVQYDRCNGFTVRAVGARGDGATLKRPPLPQCLPAKTP